MWLTAVADLRNFLSDNPDDRYNSRKKCFGLVDGENLNFRTFEFRRVTNFTTAVPPMGIYVDNTLLDVSQIAVDYTDTGEFTLNAGTGGAPQEGSVVEASYYSQWFLDDELNTFLRLATNWALSGNDATQLPNGLIPVVLKYSAAQAYTKMAQRWRTFASEMYRVEDEPKKPGTGPVESFIKMAEDFTKQAEDERKLYYSRQDRNESPLFGMVVGNVRPMP